jgi:hypothetical protein
MLNAKHLDKVEQMTIIRDTWQTRLPPFCREFAFPLPPGCHTRPRTGTHVSAFLVQLAAFPETRDLLMPYEAELMAMAMNSGSVPHRLQSLVASLQPAAFDLAM